MERKRNEGLQLFPFDFLYDENLRSETLSGESLSVVLCEPLCIFFLFLTVLMSHSRCAWGNFSLNCHSDFLRMPQASCACLASLSRLLLLLFHIIHSRGLGSPDDRRIFTQSWNTQEMWWDECRCLIVIQFGRLGIKLFAVIAKKSSIISSTKS